MYFVNKIFLFLVLLCITINMLPGGYFITVEFDERATDTIRKVQATTKLKVHEMMKKDMFKRVEIPHATIMYNFEVPEQDLERVKNCLRESLETLGPKIYNHQFKLKQGAHFFNKYIALAFDQKSAERLKELTKTLSGCIGRYANPKTTKPHVSLATLKHRKNLSFESKHMLDNLFKKIVIHGTLTISRLVLNQHTPDGDQKVYTEELVRY